MKQMLTMLLSCFFIPSTSYYPTGGGYGKLEVLFKLVISSIRVMFVLNANSCASFHHCLGGGYGGGGYGGGGGGNFGNSAW